MAGDLLKFVRKHNNLQKSWQTIKANGQRSSSPYVTDDIANFLENDQRNIKSISSKISHGSYKFGKARGVAIKKPGKPGAIRPIVMPKINDRIVQRTILDALMSSQSIKELAFQPLSFGGIPKLSGVKEAITAILEEISNGATHIMIADIKGFFTQIRKSDCVSLIEGFTNDQKFLELFKNAISVDLDNSASLWQFKDQFPYGDIGVGQGVCLSPFLGNLVLSEFDKEMNLGDCACIRYVDDIIILAPNGAAASARMRVAKRILPKGMEFSVDKSSPVPIPIDQKFEYLGIEFYRGKLRPSVTSRKSIVRRVNEVSNKSIHAMRSAKNPEEFKQDYSIPKTLNKISSMAKGWVHHYSFCNDKETILNVDRKINAIFLDYAGEVNKLAQKKIDNNIPDLAAVFLGYKGASDIELKPLEWPLK